MGCERLFIGKAFMNWRRMYIYFYRELKVISWGKVVSVQLCQCWVGIVDCSGIICAFKMFWAHSIIWSYDVKIDKARRPRYTTVSSLQGQVSMLVCNPLNWLSWPFATECTNDALGEWVGPHVSAGTVDISDINGNHYRNLTLKDNTWMSSCDWHRAGRVSHFSRVQAILSGVVLNEHNRFLCHIKCRLSALPGWPLRPIIGEANALADMSVWMDEMFFSFADTGDHTPIIITMVVYTSLCKCLLTQ